MAFSHAKLCIMLMFLLSLHLTSANKDGRDVQGRKLRGSGGGGGYRGPVIVHSGGGGGGDSGEGGSSLIWAGLGVAMILAVLCGIVVCKNQSRKAAASSCNHALSETSAGAMLAAGDGSYSSSWICDMCDTKCSNTNETFYRCQTCKIDFCSNCYASRPGQPAQGEDGVPTVVGEIMKE
eukprot:TRINITY_DN20750_c0_g2_i2.p1 TRINITY_DN20750_c0_g2~~TRINITY_DN20750_c0_g2_i2.p1  ORF type:complete len:179 (-),score=20.61 TRINITY_DN20750_c0_g2_i2:269-805(-)